MKLCIVATAGLLLSSAIAGDVPNVRPLFAGGVQKITIRVDNGFTPSAFTVQAGIPVKLVFKTVRRGCAKTVTLKELNLTRPLTNGKSTIVVFTPTSPGEINFSCPMGMFKGAIQVRHLAQRV